MNNICVYRHRRLDNNQIFYIGIGDSKRPFYKWNRNKYWKNIVNKTDYIIEIIYKNLSKEDACELEMFLIKEYGRKDLGLGNLVNMTDGGEGLFNLSQKSKDKIGIASSIRNKKPEFVEKLIIRNKNRIWTDEAREKQRNKKVLFVKGHKHKDTTKLKIGLKSSKKVINITTGQIYESAKKCSEENNINKFTLVNWLSGHRTNKSNFRYIK